MAETFRARYPVTMRAERLGKLNEIRVSVVESKIFKPHPFLLPLYHAECVIPKYKNAEINLQPHGRLKLVRIHHKAAVAADSQYLFILMHQPRPYCRRKAGAHRSESIIK